jgi:hypothetical protein
VQEGQRSKGRRRKGRGIWGRGMKGRGKEGRGKREEETEGERKREKGGGGGGANHKHAWAFQGPVVYEGVEEACRCLDVSFKCVGPNAEAIERRLSVRKSSLPGF